MSSNLDCSNEIIFVQIGQIQSENSTKCDVKEVEILLVSRQILHSTQAMFSERAE